MERRGGGGSDVVGFVVRGSRARLGFGVGGGGSGFTCGIMCILEVVHMTIEYMSF